MNPQHKAIHFTQRHIKITMTVSACNCDVMPQMKEILLGSGVLPCVRSSVTFKESQRFYFTVCILAWSLESNGMVTTSKVTQPSTPNENPLHQFNVRILYTVAPLSVLGNSRTRKRGTPNQLREPHSNPTMTRGMWERTNVPGLFIAIRCMTCNCKPHL